jgi:hypothetical protein
MARRYRFLMGTLALVGGLLAWGSLHGVGWAQEPPKPEPSATPQPTPPPEPRRGATAGDVQRVFTLRYVRVYDLVGLLRAFPAEFGYSQSSSDFPSVAVSAKPAVMAAIEEAIKRLDVPPPPEPSVEIAAYILRAETTPGKADDLPERLRPVAAQLHALFDYSGYKVQDTLVGRASHEGRVEMSSVDPVWTEGEATTTYELKVGRATATGTHRDALIELERTEFAGGFPIRNPPGTTPHFNTKVSRVKADVSLRSGQYVVVGKTGTGQEGVVIILVLTARVVD